MSQTNEKKLTWEDYANNVFPFLEPRIIELMKQQIPLIEEDRDWGQALKVLDTVRQQLRDLKTLLEQASKGEVPPSNAVRELLNRLSDLEENYAMLKTDLEMMNSQQQD